MSQRNDDEWCIRHRAADDDDDYVVLRIPAAVGTDESIEILLEPSQCRALGATLLAFAEHAPLTPIPFESP